MQVFCVNICLRAVSKGREGGEGKEGIKTKEKREAGNEGDEDSKIGERDED